jgi:hypothetical protein
MSVSFYSTVQYSDLLPFYSAYSVHRSLNSLKFYSVCKFGHCQDIFNAVVCVGISSVVGVSAVVGALLLLIYLRKKTENNG